MLRKIDLNFSETGRVEASGTGVTILVGPNNSGKSLILREILRLFSSNSPITDNYIVKDFDIYYYSSEEIIEIHQKNQKQNNKPENWSAFCFFELDARNNFQAGSRPTQEIFEYIKLPDAHPQKKYLFANQLLRWRTLRLDGMTRFLFVQEQEAGDLLDAPRTPLAYLMANDSARNSINDALYKAFDSYFVIDRLNFGKLRIRLSGTHPGKLEQSFAADAREFLLAATPIDGASDGVRAFLGLLVAVEAGDYQVYLIDEPEAFLHPPLARRMGRLMGNLSRDKKKKIFCSTHSSNFILGCLQSGVELEIIRCEYKNGKSRGTHINSADIKHLLTHPLMRSSNVLDSIFYDGVIVCESDNDRVFYNEIYQRISINNEAIPSILFLNAQNKTTVRDILGPLRRLGVPAAAIVDIDILKNGGTDWTRCLRACNIPEALHDGLARDRKSILDKLVATDHDMKTEGGIKLLDPPEQEAALDLFTRLASYGFFIVPGGEVENWLEELGVPGRKTEWAISMLTRLGGNPESPEFIRPANGDVWDFIERTIEWIANPARKGLN